MEDECACCGEKDELPVYWNTNDKNLPHPSHDMKGSRLCVECYSKACNDREFGASLADRIHTRSSSNIIATRVFMPDGTDGLVCSKCNKYFPYAETKEADFVCTKCKLWS